MVTDLLCRSCFVALKVILLTSIVIYRYTNKPCRQQAWDKIIVHCPELVSDFLPSQLIHSKDMNPYSRGSMPHSSNFGNDLDMNDAPTRNLPFNNPRRPSTDAFSGRCQMALIKRIPTRKRRREEELQSDDSGGSLLSRSGSKRLRSDLGMALEVPPPANLLNLHSSLQEYEEELPPFIDEALEAVEAKAERQHAIQFRALPSKPGDDQLIRNLPPPTIVYPELDVNAPWLYMEHVRHEVCHVLKTVLAVVTDKNYKNASVQTILSAFLGCAFKGDLTHQQFVSCVKRKYNSEKSGRSIF